MGDVVRLNEVHKNLISEYYDLLCKRYDKDCPLLPDDGSFTILIFSALRDAISYNEWLLNDSEV